jgi:hypothetical protein
MPRRPPVLTLDAAIAAVAALRELRRVCLAMDAEQDALRCTEEEYQAAMRAAEAALARVPNVRAKRGQTAQGEA